MSVATRTRKSATDQLAELRAEVRKREGLASEIEQERRQAQAGVENARQELRHYYAAVDCDREKPNPALEGKLRQAIANAEADANAAWEERHAGARESISHARAEVNLFIERNLGDLCADLAREAAKVQGDAAASYEAFRASLIPYRDLGAKWNELLVGRVPELDRRTLHDQIPYLSPKLERALHELAQAINGGFPLSVPRSLSDENADPTVKTAA